MMFFRTIVIATDQFDLPIQHNFVWLLTNHVQILRTVMMNQRFQPLLDGRHDIQNGTRSSKLPLFSSILPVGRRFRGVQRRECSMT
jgi:hypothetical protein